MADVVVKIGAETSGLKNGLNSAKADVAGFANSAGGMMESFGAKMIGAFSIGGIIGIATGLLAKFTTGIFEMAGNLQDMSERTGVGAKTLQALSGYFEQSGVKSEDLSKALVQLNNQLVDAQTKLGPARDAFDRLGVTWEQIRDSSPEEMLSIIAERMSEGGNQAEKMAGLSDLLGTKLASKLAPGLRGGAQAIHDFVKEWAGLSDVDIAVIDQMGDAFGKLLGKLTAISALKIMPLLYAIAKVSGMDDLASKMENDKAAQNPDVKKAYDAAMAIAYPPEKVAEKEDPKVTKAREDSVNKDKDVAKNAYDEGVKELADEQADSDKMFDFITKDYDKQQKERTQIAEREEVKRAAAAKAAVDAVAAHAKAAFARRVQVALETPQERSSRKNNETRERHAIERQQRIDAPKTRTIDDRSKRNFYPDKDKGDEKAMQAMAKDMQALRASVDKLTQKITVA